MLYKYGKNNFRNVYMLLNQSKGSTPYQIFTEKITNKAESSSLSALFFEPSFSAFSSQKFSLYVKIIGHITTQNAKNDVSNFLLFNFVRFEFYKVSIKLCKSQKALRRKDYLLASSIATATATVIPTIGLLPAPMRPIISTWAGTEEEPANCASECILPMVSVMP